MKKIKNFYNTIVDIKKIQQMYDHKIKLNTKNKKKLENFENNYVSNMFLIKSILEHKKYIPGKYNIFLIKEPKIRLIMSQNIIDKIINHMVAEYFLIQIYDKTLIDTNIATRKTKGTNYGRIMLKKYLNKLKGKEFYILKFDISKYFYNISHSILKKLIRKKIQDQDVLRILDDIIDSIDNEYINNTISKLKDNLNINDIPLYRKGYGLPIGNLTSQILAIMYLDELDRYIKEKLKIKYYI